MSISDVISRVLANRDGAAGVEFALMLPTMVLFVIGIVDVGALTYEQTQVSAAAHAGAQYAIRNGGSSLTNIASAVTSATPFTVQATPAPQQVKACVNGGALVVTTAANCGNGSTTPGTYIQVNATATYTPLISFGALTMPTALSAQAMVRTQ